MAVAELFSCGLCGKTFTIRGRFNQHKRTHSKPYQCSHCGKGFALRADLRRHVQARHQVGNARFPCSEPDCLFKATRKDNLRQHERLQHKDSSSTGQAKSIKATDECENSPPALKIWQAAQMGNLSMLYQLIGIGAYLDSTADDGSTALHCAARAGSSELVALLMKMGANAAIRNHLFRTPLMEAIKGGNADIVRMLLRAGNITNEYEVLDEGLKSNSSEIIRELMKYFEAGCHQTSFWKSMLIRGARFGCDRVVNELLNHPEFDPNKTQNSWNALHAAAYHGHCSIVQMLLDSGEVDVNQNGTRGETALQLAAEKGHGAVVRLLLSYKDLEKNHCDFYGSNALHKAAYGGSVEVCDYILSHAILRADCRTNIGQTPLHKSTIRGHIDLVKLLLEHEDVAPNCQDNYGRTPLHYASGSGHVDVVKLLLQQEEIEADCKNKRNVTPLHMASRIGHIEIVKLLLEREDVDINARVDKQGDYWHPANSTALYLARMHHWEKTSEIRDEIINLLLAHGAVNDSHESSNMPDHTSDLVDIQLPDLNPPANIRNEEEVDLDLDFDMDMDMNMDMDMEQIFEVEQEIQ